MGTPFGLQPAFEPGFRQCVQDPNQPAERPAAGKNARPTGTVYQTNLIPTCSARGELACVLIVPNAVLVGLMFGAPIVT